MKKLHILFILFLAVAFILISCIESTPAERTNNKKVEEPKRIKLIERTAIGTGLLVYIIEVDGKEYLTNYEGGFVELGCTKECCQLTK